MVVIVPAGLDIPGIGPQPDAYALELQLCQSCAAGSATSMRVVDADQVDAELAKAGIDARIAAPIRSG